MKQETIDRAFARMPVLLGERLLLRAMRRDDAHDMFEYACRARVTEYLLWLPHPDEGYTYDYLSGVETQYRDGTFFDWAVTLRESGKMIGTCGFNGFDLRNDSADIGYVFNPEYWGRGYASEAVRAVLRFGFIELGLNRIEARHMLGNDRSAAVMERCGMQYEGTLRDAVRVGAQYKTVCVHSILYSEYIARAIAGEKEQKYENK